MFANLLHPINFNLHRSCNPSSLPGLADFPVIATSHTFHSPALTMYKMFLAKLAVLPGGKCPNMHSYFFIQTSYLSL